MKGLSRLLQGHELSVMPLVQLAESLCGSVCVVLRAHEHRIQPVPGSTGRQPCLSSHCKCILANDRPLEAMKSAAVLCPFEKVQHTEFTMSTATGHPCCKQAGCAQGQEPRTCSVHVALLEGALAGLLGLGGGVVLAALRLAVGLRALQQRLLGDLLVLGLALHSHSGARRACLPGHPAEHCPPDRTGQVAE